jgi:hypothetical protein
MALEVLAHVAAVGLTHGRWRDRAFANGLGELGPRPRRGGVSFVPSRHSAPVDLAIARRLVEGDGLGDVLGRAPLRCGPAYLAFVSDTLKCRVRHVSRHNNGAEKRGYYDHVFGIIEKRVNEAEGKL